MYRFPADPQRRKIWENKVSRVGWKPTSSSCLCEIHFDESQFENGRADGKKKLKWQAVPTIFCHRSVLKPRRPLKRLPCTPNAVSATKKSCVSFDHTYCINPADKTTSTSSSVEDTATEDENYPTTSSVPPSKPRMKMQGRIKALKTELRKTKKQYRAIQKAKLKQESRTARIFGKDQLNAMSRRAMNGVQWSPATVKKALQLRFSCGSAGYKVLLKLQYPLPSERTLQRRLQNISFQPGVLTQVFELLKLKVDGLTKEERLCCLTLDEMSLTQKVEYDVTSGHLVGDVTLPRHCGSADHALVFMLGGVTSRWKQTIGYHFTSGSTYIIVYIAPPFFLTYLNTIPIMYC